MDNLVDSSAWIEFFRGNSDYLFISDLISSNAICTNELILSELLPSIIHKKERALADIFVSVKKYPLNIEWQEVRDIQLLNLTHGNNNIGISDIIIAQNCMQNGLRIIARDNHFAAMAIYVPLKVHG